MPASELYVSSSLPGASKQIYAVPERYRSCGLLGELAAHGERCSVVPVPVLEAAVQRWARDLRPKPITQPNDVQHCFEVLQVRAPAKRACHALQTASIGCSWQDSSWRGCQFSLAQCSERGTAWHVLDVKAQAHTRL